MQEVILRRQLGSSCFEKGAWNATTKSFMRFTGSSFPRRGNYALKESKLASVWSNACGFNPKTTARGKSAVAWKSSGTEGAGNFSAVMYGYLFRLTAGKQEHEPGEKDLKVEDINNKLNELAAAASAEEKTAVLQWLVQRSSARMLKWITQIILKDLKIGMSDKSVLRDFHPDAEDLYNVTMDLSTVCNELKDRNKRMPRRDVEPGRPVRSQLASAAKSPEEAFRRMKNKTFVVETKFDGDRIQLHRNGNDIQYYSRRGVEHGEYSGFTVMDTVVKKQLKHEKCILDGEMIVWNKTRKVFEPFGGIRSAFSAARDGKPVDSQIEMASSEGLYTSDPDYNPPCVGDIELVFIAFDILFVDEESVINRPLLERLDLLKAAIQPPPEEGIPVGRGTVQGRLAKLVPNEFVLDHTTCSKICHTMEDIQAAFDEAIRVQEEGIIIKALDSAWQMNDRSNAWLKIKPDYVHSNDIDAVIIGAFYGTGRHGGLVTQWLLALAEAPPGGSKGTPTNFMSFCKVGNGMTDAELQTVRDKLDPYFVPFAQKPKNYKVTNSRKTQPDMWVKDVSKSIVLQVQADVRTIISKDFATRHSLRFPRVERIRYDKSPFDVQTDQELWDLVNQNKGAVTGGESLGLAGSQPQPRFKKKAKQASPQGVRKATVVEHLMPADVSSIKQESSTLKACCIHFINYGQHSKQEMEAVVRKLGGTVYQNWTKDVTHLIASNKDFKFGAHVKQQRDVVCLDWLLECQQKQERIPIKPHHYLHLSKKTLLEVPDVCRFGDMYYVDIAACDVQAVLENHTHMEDIDITRLPLLASSHGADSLELPATPQPADRGQRVMRTALEVIMDVESELALHGYADPCTSLFRGCHLCFLPLHDPQHQPHPAIASDAPNAGGQPAAGSAAAESRLFQSTVDAAKTSAATQAALLDCQARRVALQVQIHGGNVAETLVPETTHVIIDRGPASQQASLMPLEVMQAVTSKLGGLNGLRLFRRNLVSGQLKLVAPSWVGAGLLALEHIPADARRADESAHAVDIAGAIQCIGSAEDKTCTVDYRPEGWPWGEAGLVDAPTPEKHKKNSRHKRSVSPVSHLSNTEPDAAALNPSPAKRAKRAAAVGAAKIVKRPNRKGQATALGGADPQPVPDDITTKDAAVASKGSSGLPNQATADQHEAEEQQDNDWEPSPAEHNRKAATRGRKKAEPAKKLRKGRMQQPVVDSDSPDSEGPAEEELASSSHLAEGRAVRKSGRRKNQVIEDDNLEDVRDSQPSSSRAADQIQLTSSGAELAGADADNKAAGASLGTQASRPSDRAAKSGSVLDRVAGLSSVLRRVPNKTVDSTNAPKQRTAAGDTADMAEPVGPKNSGKPSSVSLLDAIMNADEDDCYAAPVPTLGARPEQPRAAQLQGTGTGASDEAAEQMLHNNVVTQPNAGQSQHQQLAPAELTLPPNVVASAGSPKPKSSLRERMKAFGVIKS
ncbi:TPA: hypothetical protein ACH3X2_005613 [Trebouxia sp. C0005]